LLVVKITMREGAFHILKITKTIDGSPHEFLRSWMWGLEDPVKYLTASLKDGDLILRRVLGQALGGL
jgi:hypothetical protein